MPLSDVLHQQAAQDRLRRALSSRRVPHAYVFTGPPGVGKEMLATRLAQLLLCGGPAEDESPNLFGGGDTEPQASSRFLSLSKDKPQASSRFLSLSKDKSPASPDACGRCTDCTLFAAGTHPDFHRIYRTLNKMHPEKKVRDRKAIDLSIDVIRHFVLGPIGLRPSRDRAKVFVVAEADRMSTQAQNALLKTLEEPPGHSYIILLSAASDLLLPTTRSRCQQIPFGTLPDSFVQEQLAARRRLPPDQAAFLTQLSQGSLGEAIRFAEMGVFDRVADVLTAVQRAGDDPLAAGKALADLAKDLSSDAESVEDEETADTNAAREAQALVIAMAAVMLRDAQRVLVGSAAVAMPGRPEIAALARKSGARPMGESIKALALAEYQIDQNANTSLIFDSVGIAIGRAFGAIAAVTK